MSRPPPALSIVVPAYNESARFEPFAHDLGAFLRGWNVPHEVLWIDDGSTDDTAAKVERVCASYGNEARPWRLLRQGTNRGKGAAVQRGVQESRGEAVLFMDADGSFSPDQIPDIWKALERAPVAVGNRNDPASRIEQPLLRRWVSRGSSLLTRILFGTGLPDHSCGFKGFRREAAETLFASLSDPRWTFDVEILWRARQRGLEVASVPVRCVHRPGSRLRPLDPLRMLGRLVRLRLASRAGSG